MLNEREYMRSDASPRGWTTQPPPIIDNGDCQCTHCQKVSLPRIQVEKHLLTIPETSTDWGLVIVCLLFCWLIFPIFILIFSTKTKVTTEVRVTKTAYCPFCGNEIHLTNDNIRYQNDMMERWAKHNLMKEKTKREHEEQKKKLRQLVVHILKWPFVKIDNGCVRFWNYLKTGHPTL